MHKIDDIPRFIPHCVTSNNYYTYTEEIKSPERCLANMSQNKKRKDRVAQSQKYKTTTRMTMTTTQQVTGKTKQPNAGKVSVRYVVGSIGTQ